MKLEKAIEILTHLERTLAPTMSADGTDAIKLGIEALRRIRTLRAEPQLSAAYLLPGESQ